MKLIITRHGETEENKTGIMMWHLPGKLSETGVSQAKKVALRLKDEDIDYIYSSDLARAADTAKEITKYHQNTPIEFTTELRERNLGEFQWKKKSDLGYDLNKFLWTSLEIKKWETMKQLYERAESFLKSIIKKHQKDSVLLVWHNWINLALIANIIWKKYDEIDTIEKQHNTSINIFEIDKDRNYKIHVFNCIKHLD